MAAAALLLLLAAGPLLALGMVLALTQGRPLFFRQTRLGRHGRPFRIHKFRTLQTGTEDRALVTPTGLGRTTALGPFLRRSHLDELPQVVDILRGRMSLVGPRPEIPALADRVPPEVKNRVLSVRPGLTSRAEIDRLCEDEVLAETAAPETAYREVLVPDKFRAEARALERRGFRADFTTLLLTVLRLLRRNRRSECRARLRRRLKDTGHLDTEEH